MDFSIKDRFGNRVSCDIDKRKGSRIVIMCHGLGSSKSTKAFRELRKRLSISSVSFDFFGHGDSDGLQEDLTPTLAIASLEAVHSQVLDRGYKEIDLIGSSFGGFASISLASRTPLARLILKSPAIDFQNIFRRELGRGGLEKWEKEGTIKSSDYTLAYGFLNDARSYDLFSLGKKIRSHTLMVHGGMDGVVPLSDSIKFYNNLVCEKKLDIIKDADHRFTKGFDRLIASILSFLEPRP